MKARGGSNTRLGFTRWFAVALTVWATSALAQQTDGGATPDALPDEAGLEALLSESVVSSASRVAETASEAPATTWSISGTDLKRYGIQSVEEALRYLGHGITSYEYDQRMNTAFAARGYFSDQLGLHLSVLIDGNQAGPSAKTSRSSQLYRMPIELVDHIEVLIGPGSVIYGQTAMLGVVNVITRSGKSLERPTVVGQVSGGLPADRWARNLSWGELWGRAAAYGGSGFTLLGDPVDAAWHLSVRFDRQQGRSAWRTIQGKDSLENELQNNTREDVFNRDLGARVFTRATWGHFKLMGSVMVNQGTGTGPIEGDPTGRFFESEYQLDLAWQKPLGDRLDLTLRGYLQVWDSYGWTRPSFDTREASCAELGAGCYDLLRLLSVRPYLEPLLAIDWFKDGSSVTTVGAQVFMDLSVISFGVTAANGSGRRDEEPVVAPLPNAAAYAQHIFRFKKGSINLGVRGDVGVLGQAFTPRVALNFYPWDNGTLKLIASSGFRNPTITERFLEIPGFLIENPEIGPEHVYSAEIVLAQRFLRQNVQVSIFGTYWEGLITTRYFNEGNGERISQFANLRQVAGLGINAGWQGEAGPFDWGLSVNYAPGRTLLPGNVAALSDQQLSDARLSRPALDRYGVKAGRVTLLPIDGMPDFYATGHLSFSFGAGLPRLSAAFNLNSPRFRTSWSDDLPLLDPRNVQGPVLPWSVDLRAAAEWQLLERVGLRLTVTGNTLAGNPNTPRVGSGTGPVPTGGVGRTTNPNAPLSAMLEVSVGL